MKTTNTIACVLLSAGIGALAGILLAPKSGADTRKAITDKGNDTLHSAQNKLDELLSYITNKYDTLVSDAKKLAQHGKDGIAEEIKYK